MFNFSTLESLIIPEGVVEQIKNENGMVLWTGGKSIVLGVEKITANTYAGETTYENEEFILLDIYPKTNGTVKITYGDLTKTITDTSGSEEPNAQQVFFGTFNGNIDEVATPSSGKLTIKGDYYAFGLGSFSQEKKYNTYRCGCVVKIYNWGTVELIPNNAFGGVMFIYTGSDFPKDIVTPPTIKSIGSWAFSARGGLTTINLQGVLDIDMYAFINCSSLTTASFPNVTSIGSYAFYNCRKLDMTNIFCEGLTVIEDYAFSIVYTQYDGFTDVAMHNKSIILPSTITKIGDFAFANQITDSEGYSQHYCYLEEVKILATIPPTIGANTFGGMSLGADASVNRIVVPKGCGEIYKAAEGWEHWGTKVVEEA